MTVIGELLNKFEGISTGNPDSVNTNNLAQTQSDVLRKDLLRGNSKLVPENSLINHIASQNGVSDYEVTDKSIKVFLDKNLTDSQKNILISNLLKGWDGKAPEYTIREEVKNGVKTKIIEIQL